jgi:hypothetical protein
MLFSIIKHLLAGYSDNGRFIVPLDTNKLIIIPYTSQLSRTCPSKKVKETRNRKGGTDHF